MSDILLKVENLNKSFPAQEGFFGRSLGMVKAVQNISFELRKGDTLGIVGESGCGKSTLARCLARMLEPESGRLLFQNQDITHLHNSELRSLRRQIQMIFQDPGASLNPRLTIEQILEEPLTIHKLADSKKERRERMLKLLEMVGLPATSLTKYPREFSGGQRQRIGIARALAVEPQLLICDEPISSLDVSIRSQILNLLMDLQETLQLTLVFIAHDLNVVQQISSHVGVMYLGQIVEMAPANELYRLPQHPYTQALLSAIPRLEGPKEKRLILKGELPSPHHPPSGCPFHPRCPIALPECSERVPKLELKRPQHAAACLRVDPL